MELNKKTLQLQNTYKKNKGKLRLNKAIGLCLYALIKLTTNFFNNLSDIKILVCFLICDAISEEEPTIQH